MDQKSVRLQQQRPFRLLTIAGRVLALSSAITLASCNNAGTSFEETSLSAASATKQARRNALQRLADRLKAQNQTLASTSEVRADGVDVAKLRPAEPLRHNLLSTTVAAAPQTLEPNVQLASYRPASPTRSVESAIRQSDKPGNAILRTNKSAFGALGRFHRKLTALKSRKRKQAVTILHIGDSHVASDSFSRGIRRYLQAEYGDAGRGAVIPARAFKYGVADQIKLSSLGNWRSSTALRKRKGGRFGLSGVSVTSRSSRSTMKLTSNNGTFDWATVTVASGPSQGEVVMNVGKTKKRFNAYSRKKGAKTFRLNATGRTLEVRPGGGAKTTILNWATGKNRVGIRYVNFGLIGATVDITKRFDLNLVEHDIRQIDPDLIIYGYGTNEGFNDRLNLKSYRAFAKKYVRRLRDAAPNADLVFIGAASGLRKRGNKACNGWSTPPKLQPLRRTVKQLANEESAAYWDWSVAMGGKCAVNAWAKRGLAARDRVHLTSRGYNRSANEFAGWLMTPQSGGQTVASR